MKYYAKNSEEMRTLSVLAMQYIENAALRKVLGHDEAVVVLNARAEALKHLARAQYAQKCNLIQHFLRVETVQSVL